MATVGSYGGVVSYERGTPVPRRARPQARYRGEPVLSLMDDCITHLQAARNEEEAGEEEGGEKKKMRK